MMANDLRTLRIGSFELGTRRTPEGVIELWAGEDLGLAAGLGWAHARDLH